MQDLNMVIDFNILYSFSFNMEVLLAVEVFLLYQ